MHRSCVPGDGRRECALENEYGVFPQHPAHTPREVPPPAPIRFRRRSIVRSWELVLRIRPFHRVIESASHDTIRRISFRDSRHAFMGGCVA